MPTNIEGEPLWHEIIVGPADTDDADAPSMCDALKLLQDNARWLDAKHLPINVTDQVTIGNIADTDPHDYAFDGAPTVTVEAYAPNATIQVQAQFQPIEIAGIYHLQLLLHDGVSTVVAAGPVNAHNGATGATSVCLAYFEGIDEGTYELRLRVTDVGGVGHTSKAYSAVMTGLRIGGHTS